MVKITGLDKFTRTLDDARRNPRAGAKPLVVRAIGQAGARYMCDAIISDPDADKMLRENQTSRFLDRCDVIFVVDAPR